MPAREDGLRTRIDSSESSGIGSGDGAAAAFATTDAAVGDEAEREMTVATLYVGPLWLLMLALSDEAVTGLLPDCELDDAHSPPVERDCSSSSCPSKEAASFAAAMRREERWEPGPSFIGLKRKCLWSDKQQMTTAECQHRVNSHDNPVSLRE